ncbi:MAG: hypothetical protein RLZZ77_1462 [Bacteroidota bacterium]
MKKIKTQSTYSPLTNSFNKNNLLNDNTVY